LKEEDKAGQQSFLKFLRMFVFAQIFWCKFKENVSDFFWAKLTFFQFFVSKLVQKFVFSNFLFGL
jgi:hypothetical protein